MKITMENIGVMRYAELVMGDLTIICGDNNTGKTLTTHTTHGFFHFWNTQYQIPIEDGIVEELKNAGSYTIQLEGYVKQAPQVISNACLEYSENLRVQLNNENASFNFTVSSEEIKINDSEYEDTMGLAVTQSACENEVSFSIVFDDIPDNNIKVAISNAIKSIVFSSVCPVAFIVCRKFNLEREGGIFYGQKSTSRNNNAYDAVVIILHLYIYDSCTTYSFGI